MQFHSEFFWKNKNSKNLKITFKIRSNHNSCIGGFWKTPSKMLYYQTKKVKRGSMVT